MIAAANTETAAAWTERSYLQAVMERAMGRRYEAVERAWTDGRTRRHGCCWCCCGSRSLLPLDLHGLPLPPPLLRCRRACRAQCALPGASCASARWRMRACVCCLPSGRLFRLVCSFASQQLASDGRRPCHPLSPRRYRCDRSHRCASGRRRPLLSRPPVPRDLPYAAAASSERRFAWLELDCAPCCRPLSDCCGLAWLLGAR